MRHFYVLAASAIVRPRRAMNPFGAGRLDAPNKDSQRVACFSEVPFGQLSRLVTRRSRFGIGFTKKFATKQGANPIWYLEKDGPGALAFIDLKEKAIQSPDDSILPLGCATWSDFAGTLGLRPIGAISPPELYQAGSGRTGPRADVPGRRYRRARARAARVPGP